MITLPTLFKKASTGKIQTWTIGVDKNDIVVNHGQQGGKIQRKVETIKVGKNIGKSNETTPAEQALAEATSRWEGKIKSGYVEDVNRAEAGEKDIDGGYDCMLAHKYADHGHKIVFPAYEQPKLNGHRCLAIVDNGVATLWSRTRKPITSMPHIVKELQDVYPKGYHEIDGELYNHAYKDGFEHITHLIRQEVPLPDHADVEYHVYDKRMESGFGARIERLGTELHTYEKKHGNLKHLKLVQTILIKDEDEMMEVFDQFLALGYEGGMARNADGLYESKRSYNLQKIKEFQDDNYPIVDCFEGKGTYAKCGIFRCLIPTAPHKDCLCNECTFKVKMRGPQERLKEFLKNPKLWKGKELVVKYQYISVYGCPIFPVGERFV